jgi:thiamine-monophosphate kinase
MDGTMTTDGGDGVTRTPERIADLGEDRLVSLLLDRLTAVGAASSDSVTVGTHIVLGPGDDAAVVRSPEHLVLSTDTMVEGTDFRRDWSTADDVGVKIAAQNLADVAAMGAVPVGVLISLAVPGELAVSWAEEFVGGLGREVVRAGGRILGGDVAESEQIVVTVAALGSMAGPPVRRDGARPGDVVALSGRTGLSAAGLALLDVEVARRGSFAELLTAHRAPRPDYTAGPRAAVGDAHALIDTSDGLVRDAIRIATASGVLLDLDPMALVPIVELVSAAEAVIDAGRPPRSSSGTAEDLAWSWVLTGGEDHALLACFPAGRVLPDGFVDVGRVYSAESGPAGVMVGGRPVTGDGGWTAFRSE